MDYLLAENYIKGLSGRGIVLGLDTVKRLLDMLGNPQDTYPIIHVAGTNGKGSFGAYMSSVIESNGMACARFVSPCVGEYENTFLVNGKPIAAEILNKSSLKVKSAITELEADGIFPTSFIAETALAFTVFSEIKPDFAIIECGMGGQDDATNVIATPKLSVITKISLDHTAYLGETITEIATVKSGIIKNGTPVVSAIQCPDAMKVIADTCKRTNSKLYTADTAKLISLGDITVFSVNAKAYETQMLGTYQPENASLAITAAKVLGINDTAIEQGIKNAFWEYRFMRIGKYILDGAHNPDGAEALAKSLREYTTPEDTAFICGSFRDKDYAEIAKITSAEASAVYCVTPPTARGLDKAVLCDTFKNTGIKSYTADSIEDAISQTKAYKNVVIFGTLSILSDTKKIIERSNENGALQ